VVFLVGLEEAVFPHKRSLDDPSQLEEERRLAYVGITRAKQQLIVSHARKRTVFGETQPAIPSRFLREIPPLLLNRLSSPLLKMQAKLAEGAGNVSGSRYGHVGRAASPTRRQDPSEVWMQEWDAIDPRAASQRPAAQAGGKGKLSAADLAVGDRVRHEKFGEGVVARIIGQGDRATIAISFPGLGQKILDPRLAPLERLGG
jgi:DNA helicase-2/ATP-dependent DNA helicase PcrA